MDPRALTALSDDEFVESAYLTLLRRPVDHEARARARTRLADGTLSREEILAELTGSDEFARIRALDDGIASALAGDPQRGLTAPPGDERPIEIPWALGRARGAKRVLDAGSAFAEPAYLAALVTLGADELVAVDLATVDIPELRAVVADLRDLPFEEGSFDIALCISTIEHVGFDNSVYGIDAERDGDGIARALGELRRVLAPDGRLVVTVPTGAREDHGWFVQLEPEEWRARFAAAGFDTADEETYALGPKGWAAAEDVAGARYREQGAGAVLCAELTPARAGGSRPAGATRDR
ncbi:MAG: class I SAM-dependent methyltransferase [Thermoleophilia bacterium]